MKGFGQVYILTSKKFERNGVLYISDIWSGWEWRKEVVGLIVSNDFCRKLLSTALKKLFLYKASIDLVLC